MISFCITCRNRLSKLRQTLPYSLSDIHPLVQFTLLDYSSDDGLDEWILDLRHYVENGYMDYFRADGISHYDSAHAKNACSLLAQGDVVCNLDADNFAETEFQEFLVAAYRNLKTDLVCTDLADGTHGRIAIRKTALIALGGYDESFVGYGWDDNDLRERASRSGKRITFGPRKLYREIQDLDKSGDYVNPNTVETNELNQRLSRENVRSGRLIANSGSKWGTIKAMKNWEELVET